MNENIEQYENTEKYECIICLDDDIVDGSKPKEIKYINNTCKTCNCDFIVHPSCLQKWLIKNNTCIICSKEINYIQDSVVIDPSVPNEIVVQNLPPPPYFVYSPNNTVYLSDTSSETASYYSNELSIERLNNQIEKKNFICCLTFVISIILIICIFFQK